MIGWAAATGTVGVEAVVLFLIVFLWQFPHFLAIAWVHREDYARGGHRMLPCVDPSGAITARQSVVHALVLVPVGLMPTVVGVAGGWYFAGCPARGPVLSAPRRSASRRDVSDRPPGGSSGASFLYLPVDPAPAPGQPDAGLTAGPPRTTTARRWTIDGTRPRPYGRDEHPAPAAGTPSVQAPPVSPGKVAMWLFLATEVMFFTGLIGSYVVLRAGSPPTAFSNLYAPATDLKGLEDSQGVEVESVGPNPIHGRGDHPPCPERRPPADRGPEPRERRRASRRRPRPHRRDVQAPGRGAGPRTGIRRSDGQVEGAKTYNWPQPYDHETNPLSIDLTAVNTFFLICSSVTMVLALSAVQRNDQKRLVMFLAATVLIGSVFVGIQFIEYRKLMFADAHSIGREPQRPFPARFQPVRLVLLHDDRIPRSPRHRRRDPPGVHPDPGDPRQIHRRESQLRRAGRPLLALRGPRVDLAVHGRLPDLTPIRSRFLARAEGRPMTEPHRTFDQQQHVESHAPYMTLFFVLLNYTAMEYVYAKCHTLRVLPLALMGTGVFLTIVTAVVAGIFHWHFNRRWVYLTILPAVLLSFLPLPLIVGLLILAVTKAALVGIWFMHLKFEGRWVYYMLVPAGILAVIFTTALYPDMAMQTTADDQESQEEPLSSLGLPPAPARVIS